jgi:hypothetical protein
MRTRRKGYEHYGFADRKEVQKWLQYCRNLNEAETGILQEAAAWAYPAIASLLVESLVHGVSYQKMEMSVEIPICEKDFYGYRRKTLAMFRNMIESRKKS